MKKKRPPSPERTRLAVGIVVCLFLVVAIAALACTRPAHADEATNYAWNDVAHRGSFGVGAGYAWHTGEESNLPTTRKEFEAGAYGAYSIVPVLTGTAYAVRGFDNRTWRAGIGPRLKVWKSTDARQGASVSLRYAWHAGPESELPSFRHEWEMGAEYGYRISDPLSFVGTSAFGFDSHTFRSAVGLRYRLF